MKLTPDQCFFCLLLLLAGLVSFFYLLLEYVAG